MSASLGKPTLWSERALHDENTVQQEKILPRSGSTGSFFSDEPITSNIVQGFFNSFFENEDSAANLTAYLGDDLIEMEPYDNLSAGNGVEHSGIFVRFRTEHHLINEIKAFVATLD